MNINQQMKMNCLPTVLFVFRTSSRKFYIFLFWHSLLICYDFDDILPKLLTTTLKKQFPSSFLLSPELWQSSLLSLTAVIVLNDIVFFDTPHPIHIHCGETNKTISSALSERQADRGWMDHSELYDILYVLLSPTNDYI